MKKLIFIIIGIFLEINNTFASILSTKQVEEKVKKVENTGGSIVDGTWFELVQGWGIMGNILAWIFLVIFLVIAYILLKKGLQLWFEVWYAKNLRYLRVTLPKADSKLDKEKETKKDFKEKIGIMSMFYKAIHKISEAGLKDTILNMIFKHSKISLELVYDKGEVHFYIVTYKNYVNIVSQHLTSNYPDAEIKIIDPKEGGYIKLKEKGYKMRAASLGKEHDDFYPIKTFKYLEDDPINNFTNVFGGLGKEDKAIFQLVIKPESSRYNKRAKKAAGLVAKGKYKKGTRNIWGILSPLSWLYNPLRGLFEGTEGIVKGTNAPGASEGDAYKIFNQAETESQKIMGEAAAQPSFKSSIRVIVASQSSLEAQNGVHAIVAASSIFTDEYNNALDNPQVIEDALHFIITPLRYFAFKYKLVGFFQNISYFSTDEVSTLFHLPDITYNRSPIISWLEYKKLNPPHNLKFPKEATMLLDFKRDKDNNVIAEDGRVFKINSNLELFEDEEGMLETVKGQKVKKDEVKFEKIPSHRHLGGFGIYKDGVLMGWNEYRNKKTPIYFNRKDRGRHHYVIGKSGGGKSVFIGYLARQDVRNGDGVCVIDPHGDLVEDVLAFTPKERAKDVVVFDPADDERPMGLNMLEVISEDEEGRKREMDRAALDATEIFIKIFGDEIFGPRIQHYFRNGCLTLMEDSEDGGTLIDVPRLFTDDAFMKYKTSKVKNPVVKSFWDHEYANTGDREKQEMIPYFSSKFGPFITNTTIRNIIGQPKSAFNIREMMDNRKILLVNLSKGKIGALNAQLLGLIFVSKVNMAAMSRADMPEKDRKDFFMYVDEFQNFATDTFGEILSEARKYHLALIMAHQFIAQIGGKSGQKGDKPSIKDAVFGNAGTIMSFKVGAEDAEYMEKEYAPLLSQQDIIGIANFTAYCKLNIDNATTRPFDLKTIWDNNYKSEKIAAIIKEYSRKKYGRKRKYVDMEIEARLGIQTS
ncbi:type IV secretory system conjugative DNA transfer family protein [Candidatus Gracilibacteria bacterium]|nr:MAG: type IV secretory system conjugative DNA transfer family protein [Candidatus Gracilibacteria bacterium]